MSAPRELGIGLEHIMRATWAMPIGPEHVVGRLMPWGWVPNPWHRVNWGQHSQPDRGEDE